MRKHAFNIMSKSEKHNVFGLSLTAIVLMPVKSVTVADPPRISMEETIIFVASLGLVLISMAEVTSMR